ALDPCNTDAAGILALSYMSKRQFPDALAELDYILAFDPSNRQAIEIKAFCLWAMRVFEADDLLLTIPDISLHLRGHHALTKGDEAIPIIKRLVHIASFNSISIGLMHIDPVWDPIRSDPRFQELVAEKKPVNPKKF